MDIKQRLQRGLTWAAQNGIAVIAEDFGSRRTQCGCLLSCTAWAEGSTEATFHSERDLKSVLNLTYSEVRGFDSELHALGTEFRKQVFGS